MRHFVTVTYKGCFHFLDWTKECSGDICRGEDDWNIGNSVCIVKGIYKRIR